ncbi:MAG: CDP-alcohol phosphatidyltransferase family protein [Candidatus Saccharicenans sp.]
MIEEAVIIYNEKVRKSILGLPLLMRQILNGNQAGLKKFYVLGPDCPENIQFIKSINLDKRIRSLEIQINYLNIGELLKTADSSRPDFKNRNFFLMTGDTLCSPQLFKNYVNLDSPLEKPLIFTRKKANLDEDSMEELNLAICPGRIWPRLAAAVGKELANNSILKLSTLFSEFSFSYLQNQEIYFYRITSGSDEKRAIRALLSTARKPQDGFIARKINRPISLFLTRYLIKFNLSPTKLSIFNFILGLGAAFLVSLGQGYWYFLAGAFLFEFSSIFDGCDGEVARLTYQTSEKGALTDVIFDALTYILFFIGLAVGLYRQTQSQRYLVMLILFLLSVSWYYINLYRYTRASGIGTKIFLVAKEVEASSQKENNLTFLDRILSKLAFAVRRDFFATLVFALMAMDWSAFTLYLVIGGSWVESIYFHFYVSRKLDRPRTQPENYFG